MLEHSLLSLKRVNGMAAEDELHGITIEQVVAYLEAFDFYPPGKQEVLIEVEIVRSPSGNTIGTEPRVGAIFAEIRGSFRQIISEQDKIQSIGHFEFQTRNQRRMMISDEENPVYEIASERLTAILDQHRRLFNCYLEHIIGKFEGLLEYSPEAKKKALRKSTFEEFHAELKLCKSLMQELDLLMLPRKFRLGLLWVDCEALKGYLRKRISEITDEIYRLLIDKIQRENDKLFKIIQETKTKLDKDAANLEELDELRTYARETLFTELNNIYLKVNEIMKKMDLLSEMNYKINYKDFEKSW